MRGAPSPGSRSASHRKGLIAREIVEVRGFLEAVAIDQERGGVSITGWVAALTGEPVEHFRVQLGEEPMVIDEKVCGLPSPDVHASLPDIGQSERARFVVRGHTASKARVPVLVTAVFGHGESDPLVCWTPTFTSDVDGAQRFNELYGYASKTIIEFLAKDGVDLSGREVANIGCGSGLTDLAIARRARPARLVGFDILPTDVAELKRISTVMGAGAELPSCLEFQTSEPERLPAPDAAFDVVYSWSAFEHVRDPPALASEVRRVLKPTGTLMMQVWPLYHSRYGSHLAAWFPDGFEHLTMGVPEIEATVRNLSRSASPEVEGMLAAFRELNRYTLDDLQAALLSAGLLPTRVELMSEPLRIPRALARKKLSELCVSGFKLLAVPE